jgi:hypothetical protein
MFDFLDEDWFVITLEIVFIILIIYDVKQYLRTKKREYIVNIILTIGFAIWTLYPMYISYFGWEESQKKEVLSMCQNDDNSSLCQKLDDAIFKNYTYDEYKNLDKNSSEFKEFLKEAKEDIIDDSWF